MKIIFSLFFVCCLLQSYTAYAQENLIQNGSFEILDSCPPIIDFPAYSSVHYADGWDDACLESVNFNYSSPDLFNSCNSGILGVPSNWHGYQNAFDGEGYVGVFIDFNLQGGPWRDFIQNELLEPVIKGCKYKVSFQFSYSSKSSYKTDGLQFIFSNSKLTIPNDAAILNGTYFTFDEDSVTIIRFPELLEADTTDWWYFEREFYARSPARYLTIGSILIADSTINEFGWYIGNFGINSSCRGYFDDIRLIQLDSNCVTGVDEVEKKELVKVYPNPAQNSLTVFISENQEETLTEIIDIFGRVVLTKQLGNAELNMLDISSISTGWYLVRITRPLSSSFVHSVFIER